MNPIEWLKSNKLAAFLILVILFFAFFKNTINRPYMGMDSDYYAPNLKVMPTSVGMMGTIENRGMAPAPMRDTYTESVDSYAIDRKVVTETYLSLQVADVTKSLLGIKSKASSMGGFMVNSNIARPEEAATGQITVRVPASRADEMIGYMKDVSIKVVNEDIQGRDITDQYRDVETRLATLEKNKVRFEDLMDKAVTVEEILKVQTQLFSLQDQIDSLIGQRDYLKGTSDTVKITAYLSTDEFALPYVPDTSWRPEVIFKEAVRSLIMDIRSLGNKVIWLAVYAVIWIPIILIILAARRYWKRRSMNAKTPVIKKK